MGEFKVVSKLVEIPLENLHYRFIPMSFSSAYWPGQEPMKIGNSPHVEIMKIFKDRGFCDDCLKYTRYCRERLDRGLKYGMEQWLSTKYMKSHLKRRFKILKSLQRKGYRRPEKPVLILKEPFWVTRFGFKSDSMRIIGPEIWDGGGRCAAAFVLGWETIKAFWVEDAHPGKNSCRKIEGKFKK